jgi:hypothetical protein
MKSVHLVIPDLFLPKSIAAEVAAGLHLPSLQKMLGRGRSEMLEPTSLEELLCGLFDLTFQGDVPISAISAAFDGLAAGCWMRADPVHLDLQRDRLLLAGVQVGKAEAAALCASMNEYFSGQGMEFFAPHPQRWYVRLEMPPRIRTTPLSQVIGGDVRRVLPTGEDAARWHQLFNEMQMLLFAHPLNEAREARGELMINSVWLWGAGGPLGALRKSYDSASSDDVLVEMFAAAADIPYATMPGKWNEGGGDGRQLLVWNGLRAALQRGDLAAWRDALRDFETGYAQPLWQALRNGKLEQLDIVIPGEDSMRRVSLKRIDTWAFWRPARRLAEYSLV